MFGENPHLLPQNLILGIDPGLDGALAVLNPECDKILNTYAMPTIIGHAKANDQNAGRKVDPVGLAILLEKLEPRILFAVVEEVASRPHQGVVSTFTFGLGTGMIHGALAGVKIPFHLVRPDVWKILLGVSKNKESSLKKATELFPASKHLWDKSKLNGHAEAALIAYFGKRFMKTKVEEKK